MNDKSTEPKGVVSPLDEPEQFTSKPKRKNPEYVSPETQDDSGSNGEIGEAAIYAAADEGPPSNA